MTDIEYILVVNGAASSDVAPNFISVVQKNNKKYQTIIEKKTNLKGGPERFPIYFQEFVQQGVIQAQQIDLIAVIVGPGSFTGLRASIAFALGMVVGLGCPIVALRRGEALFHNLSLPQSVWHITHARRGRVFIEYSHDQTVVAYNEEDIPIPDQQVVLSGEAMHLIDHADQYVHVERQEANAEMIAKCAYDYWQSGQESNEIYPLYVDPPEAKLPAMGLRKAPI